MTSTKTKAVKKDLHAVAGVDYVDASIDAQRQYSEVLFGKAVDRVGKQLSERLEKALMMIRPGAVVDASPRVSLPDANARVLSLVKKQFEELAEQYHRITGLFLDSIEFGTNSGLDVDAIIRLRHGR
jgi:hypothetical protein